MLSREQLEPPVAELAQYFFCALAADAGEEVRGDNDSKTASPASFATSFIGTLRCWTPPTTGGDASPFREFSMTPAFRRFSGRAPDAHRARGCPCCPRASPTSRGA